MSEVEIQVERIGLKTSSTTAHNHHSATANSKRVGITTLGCKVNTYESQLIAETLQTQDWCLVPDTQVADLYLINTCTVTREADRQARQAVRKLIKRNPDALVVVTGCYAQMDPQACANIPGVDLVLGNDKKLDVHSLIPELTKGQLPKVLVGDLDQHVSLPDQLLAGYQAHTRAFVQIQQGCDQSCTFCIIHVARGPSRSLPPTLIKRQVQRLVLNGYPEIVICGVDLGSYGQDFAQHSPQSMDLVALLKELLRLEVDNSQPFRIRLSSLDPYHISDELIDLMASEARLCPHIHLSLQSGNTLILKRMKRRYDAQFVRERINRLRTALPELVMSADVMVGFPTETDAQFADTQQMIRDLKIAFAHTFSYSERNGTPAARIPVNKQVPVAQRKARNVALRDTAQTVHGELLNSLVGRTLWVLPENKLKHDDGYYHCRAENYCSVLVASNYVTQGQWLNVTCVRVEGEFLFAEPAC